MTEYKLYNNRTVINYALISSIILIASYILTNFFIVAISLVFAIIFISKAKCITYNVYDNKIVVMGIKRKEYLWTDFSDVLIGSWFIKIKTRDNRIFQIIDTNLNETEFIKLMDQIITHTNSDVLNYEDKDNPTNLGIKGSLILLFIHLIAIGFVYISTPLTQIAYILIGKSLWLSLSIITFSIILLVLSIVLIVQFTKRKMMAITLIKISKILGFIFLIITIISAFISYPNTMVFKTIVLNAGIVTGNFFSIFLVFKYLKTSKRVKYYFVK